jgi:hypothetical protein
MVVGSERTLLPSGKWHLGCLLAVSVLSLGADLLELAPAAQASETIYACGLQDAGGVNNIFGGYSTFGINYFNYCGMPEQSLQLLNDAANKVAPGRSAGWSATAPPGLLINVAAVPSMYLYNTVGTGYLAHFYWNTGNNRVVDGRTSYIVAGLSSNTFGWDLQCNPSGTTCPADSAAVVVDDVVLSVGETAPPSIAVSGSPNLFAESQHYVRGSWPLAFSASSVSGVCSVSADVGGQTIAGASVSPNRTVWHQCPNESWSQTINTALGYPDGPLSIALQAADAAGRTAPPTTTTVNVDNAPVNVVLSGPTSASSAAGTQYVTATATAGPSGVRDISCSLDGGSAVSYPGATAKVPVQGVAVHQLSCSAANNSIDVAGVPLTSPPSSWTLNIGQPTVSGISFSKLVGLNCKRIRARVEVPARWVTVHRHGHTIKVHRRAHTRAVKVTRCHPRVVRRKVVVWKTVRRHGRKVRVERHKTIRVVELPHVVNHSSQQVGYGKRTTVSGWLGLPDGTPLAGQRMRVLTAPDNGLGQFTEAAVATTASKGSWTAQLPPGPSRLVEAVYDGAPALEPSTSGQVHVRVPAKVKLLNVSPRRVAWGGTVRITGRLLGGYLPAGGALVRLRIGRGQSYQTYGVQEHVTGNGRFSTTYTFGVGQPSVHLSYFFQIATLPMGNYPYAPASSIRRTVIVGGHPPTQHRQKHRGPHRHRSGG